MLFKLSFNNIRKSMRDYAVYFFTLVIGVAVFYIFNSIESQTAFLEISADKREIIKLLISMLSGVSIFVAFVLGLLVVYASRFLMKRRNREFALYLTLGMGKGKISVILFLETFIIGLVSLAAGICVGIVASQFTSTFAANLFEANMSEYHFVVSGSAIAKTAICFGILYLVVMLFNGIMVGKCKLIDLMQSGKKSENMKLKNPILCVIIFLISAAALGFAYYQVTANTRTLDESTLGTMILIGSVSTFFIFWSVSGMLLRVIMSAKKLYFRGLNSFTFRQLSSKINTMVMSMTIICLMLFVTICTLTSAFSMRNTLNKNIRELCPADMMISYTASSDKKFADCEEITGKFSEYAAFDGYIDENVSWNRVFENHKEFLPSDTDLVMIDIPYEIFSLSDYNALMTLYGRKTIDLNPDEFVFICNYKKASELLNTALSDMDTLNVFGKELVPASRKTIDGFVELSEGPMNTGFIVADDSVVKNGRYFESFIIGNIPASSIEETEETESSITDFMARNVSDYGINGYRYSTRHGIADAATGLGGVVIFLGLYIGVIFLVSSGVILALRSLSDSVDSVSRYTMLRKIGADESDISKSLLRQNLLFFAIPLLVAVVHSIFGMKFAMSYVLQIFGTEGISKSIAGTGVIILLIYGGYFLITYLCSKSIIKEKR